jgi:ribosome biogenesis GTPase A
MGGLARFDYLKGDKQGFTGFFDNHLMIHRTKLEKADEFYVKHKGSLLVPPREDDMATFPKLVRKEFAIKSKSDIVFSGLGWIRVAKPAIIAAWVPEGVDVMIRKSLI